MPLINCDVSLTFTRSKNCVLTNMTIRDANPAVLEIRLLAGAIFEITDTKLYVPIVTLSTLDDNKLLEQLKTAFKRTITWNKSRSDLTNQA